MPKTIKNCFYKKLTFKKFVEAHKRARKHKTYKAEVTIFEINLENNIINLINQIKNNKYKLGNYYQFTIYEPKERIIQALPYKDRIVHQWYVEEFIKPYIIPKLINTTFACLADKGTHKAVNQVQNYMQICLRNNGDFWVLKCDIEKFFYNIDPYILFNIMKKYISDKALLRFTHLLIFCSRLPNTKIGIPIGNYTSQYFANIYLNELDQFIKRKLKIKYYVRYMDDFILLLKNKKECIEIKSIISNFLAENLHLSLNSKSRYYPYKMGVNFCGYRIFPTHRLLRKSSKDRMMRKIKTWNSMYSKNNLDILHSIQSINAWLGHTKHCNAYHLENKILSKSNFLFSSQTYNTIEKNIISDIENYNCNKDF